MEDYELNAKKDPFIFPFQTSRKEKQMDNFVLCKICENLDKKVSVLEILSY